jgi:hypothetical protein
MEHENWQTESGAEVADRRNLIVRFAGNDAADDESSMRELGTDTVAYVKERVGRLVSRWQALPK